MILLAFRSSIVRKEVVVAVEGATLLAFGVGDCIVQKSLINNSCSYLQSSAVCCSFVQVTSVNEKRHVCSSAIFVRAKRPPKM